MAFPLTFLSSILLLFPLTASASPQRFIPSPNITTANFTAPHTKTINKSASSTYLPFDVRFRDPNYNVSYPGRLREKDKIYYLLQYSHDWWRVNLDSHTLTACLCSTPRSAGLPTQIASYIQYDYYSLLHKKAYALNVHCGPVDADAHGDNYCWAFATGTGYGPKGAEETKKKMYYTTSEADGQRLSVDWAIEGKRWMTWHGHKREFDQKWMHDWDEERGETPKTCSFHCRDKFVMEMDVKGDHEASFIRTWYPPKPIPWS